MKCEVCAIGERQHQLIRYTLTQGERLILVDHVPAEVCDRCGEVTLAPDTVDRLQETVWQREAPAKTIETAVYEFA